MNDSGINFRYKNHFKNLNYYSMPISILFIVRKRLNFVFSILFLIILFVITLF